MFTPRTCSLNPPANAAPSSISRIPPPAAEQARAKVDVAYHEVAQQLHYLQMVHALTHTPQFNAFGQPQPFNPAMVPPPPGFTYGRSSGSATEAAGPTAHLSDEEARRRLANGRRRGLKRKAADEEEVPSALHPTLVSSAAADGESSSSTTAAGGGTEPPPTAKEPSAAVKPEGVTA